MKSYVSEPQNSVSKEKFPPARDGCDRKNQVSNCRHPVRSETNDEEVMFVIRAVLWMLVLAVMPLILFLIVQHSYPELFQIPITPN